MSRTDTLTLTFAGAGFQDLPGGRFLFIKSATAALDVTLTEQNGNRSQLLGVGAGARQKRTDGEPWRYTKITSALAQTVVVVISDDDEFDVANTVTVAGGVTTAEQPSTAFAVTASAALATGNHLDIAANPARRRITICNEAGGGSVWIRDTAATVNAGIELQGGQSIVMETTAALRVRNNSGSSANISTLEET